MRGEVHYDGVRLTRVMPVAWLLTAGMGALIHALAGAGWPLTHMGLQSTILVTVFFGALALVGTMQKLAEYADSGRRVSASMVGVGLVILLAATMAYGLWSYL